MLFETLNTFFDGFIGTSIAGGDVFYLLALAMCGWLVGAFVGIFSAETRRLWTWTMKVVIIVSAIIIAADVVLPLLPSGGVALCG